jgi:hypothetical protein
MVATASVLRSHKCSSERANTRRTATTSVTRPKRAPTSTAPRRPMGAGSPSPAMNHAPKTLPSMQMCPVVTLNTFEVEYMRL